MRGVIKESRARDGRVVASVYNHAGPGEIVEFGPSPYWNLLNNHPARCAGQQGCPRMALQRFKRYAGRPWLRAVHGVLAVLWVACGTGTAQAESAITLNGNWEQYVGAQTPRIVGVPSCFDPIGGVTTYVRRFTLDPGTAGSVVLLQFEGVSGQATVWLNDVLLGGHGGFTPFWFEVSGVLHGPGTENVLKVAIDDHRDATTIPYEDIPWVNSGGIIRDVALRFFDGAAIVRAGLQYTFADAQYSAVYGDVTVDLLGRAGQSVALDGGIFSGPPADLQIAAPFAPSGPIVLDSGGRGSVQLHFSLTSPQLWSPDHPQLYTLWVKASIGGSQVDQFGQRTGFRDIAVRRNDILLNGQPIFLRGVCRHDLYPDTGFVGTFDQMAHDMTEIKRMGANFVRLIHYPQHPQILALADELGLMVSCEIPAWANIFDPAVRTRLYDMYRELILRDMNHPAVILWLSGNARARPVPYAQEAQQLAKSLDRNRLASWVIDDDSYDPNSVHDDAQFIRAAGLDVYLKVTFWLYYLEFLQDAWTNFPKDLPIVLAELGFEGDNRGPVIITPQGDPLNVTEAQQAATIADQLEAWRPHLPFYADEHITGMSIYCWQDLRWPDIDRHLPSHIPALRFGLVYEDRTPKQALGTVANYYLTLPRTWVGRQLDGNAPIEPLFTEARQLSAVVNTVNRDSGPALNAAGTRLYFASDGPDYVGLPRLMVSDLVDGAWQPPQFLDIPQETEFFAFRSAPEVAFDERTLYFTRAILSGIFVAQTRIWRADLVNGRWQRPVDLGAPVNYPDPITVTAHPSLTLDGNTMYFSSDRPGGFGASDIWVTRRVGGVWQTPENLGPVVNSASNDSEPCIAPDGYTLYFSSGRPGGFGSSDLWVTHDVSGQWTTPANLGPDVNSAGSEREPYVSRDGQYLFFTGIRDGGQGLSDIWYARRAAAPDVTDLSATATLRITTNYPGVTIGVVPDDVAHQGGGPSDAGLVRRFRPGTPVGLSVPGVYNGLNFWHWVLDGAEQNDRQTGAVVMVREAVAAEALYAIPVALAIDGQSVLQLKTATAAASELRYTAVVQYLDGTQQSVRSGVVWSVSDPSAAAIDAATGALTPRRGGVTVTIRADGEVAGFKLPTATKRVELQDDLPAATNLGVCGAACGPLGLAPVFNTCVGLLALRAGYRRHAARRQ